MRCMDCCPQRDINQLIYIFILQGNVNQMEVIIEIKLRILPLIISDIKGLINAKFSGKLA